MVKQLTLWILGTLMPVFAMSQTIIRESVGSVATSYSSDHFDIQACVGQPYNTSTPNSVDHHPGFIQPQTSLTNFTELVSVKLYPNPTSDIINYTLDKELTDVVVVITDLMGNVVYQQNYSTLSSGHADCVEWATGMYFIRVIQNDQVLAIGKIIKINNR